jgi:hypothetical protein
MEILPVLGDSYENFLNSRELSSMPELFLLRTVLRTLSVVLGGFGVFYLVLSLSTPALWGLTLVLIGAASGIAYCLDR